MPDDSLTIYCITDSTGAGDGANRLRAHDKAGNRVVLERLEPCDDAEFERLKRETLAAAELRHQHIAHVLDVGRWAGRPFVAREEVLGSTLRERVAMGPLELRELLDFAVQIAHVIEAVNAVGIVHRFLSADLVVVSPRGEVTLAGFGYSRALVPRPACAAPEAADPAECDGRTDVFGWGAIVWEMATGKVPGAAPPPASSIRAGLPPLLDQIIAIALEPDPDRRFQDMSGVVQAVTLFRRGAATAQNLEKARIGASARRRRKVRKSELRWRARMRTVRMGAIALLAIVVGGLMYLLVPRYEAFQKNEIARLTTSGNVMDVALSPDATITAQVRLEGEGESLWIQRVGVDEARRLLPPGKDRFYSVHFSSDGRSVYFIRAQGDTAILYSIPVGGGEPKRMAGGMASGALTWNGDRMAFLRGAERERSVVMASLDGSNDRVVMSRQAPASPQAVAWSPDGRHLVASVQVVGEGTQLFKLDLEQAVEQQLGWHRWTGPVSVAWLPGGSGLMVVGAELGGASPVWRVNFPDGGVSPVTHDLGIYSRVSLSGDGRALATIRTEFFTSIWVVPGNDVSQAQQITPGKRPDGVGGLDWLPDGRIVFASQEGSDRGMWIMSSEGGEPRSILSGPDRASTPRVSPDGSTIAFLHFRSGTPQIWAMTPEGKTLRPITKGGAEYMPSFSPDGKTLYFASAQPSALGVWKMPIEGGRPEWLSRVRADFAVASPDGRRIAFRTLSPIGGGEVLVIPSEGGPSEARLRMDEETQIGWTRDGTGLVWASTENGVGNLWAHPIHGGAPVKVTSFGTPGEIHAFAWSRDGSRLAVARGKRSDNAVLLRDTRW